MPPARAGRRYDQRGAERQRKAFLKKYGWVPNRSPHPRLGPGVIGCWAPTRSLYPRFGPSVLGPSVLLGR